MNTIFPGYYRPSKEAFKELWQKATIALDANVMLNLYRYPTSARDDLLTTLRQVSNRLFVPYQAALEYQRGRLGTIGSQQKRFGEVDRKSTRLNSSHRCISYAVFCLKKT